jgi:hypothetical protein
MLAFIELSGTRILFYGKHSFVGLRHEAARSPQNATCLSLTILSKGHCSFLDNFEADSQVLLPSP